MFLTSVQFITVKVNTVRHCASSIGGREVNVKSNSFEKGYALVNLRYLWVLDFYTDKTRHLNMSTLENFDGHFFYYYLMFFGPNYSISKLTKKIINRLI